MAEFKQKYFGSIRGKFGDAVFRQRGDKNYISKRANYKKPETEEFKMRTDTFKFSCQLASQINNNQYLKAIWQTQLGKQIFPGLVSLNYNAFKNGTLAKNPMITPDKGIGVKVDSLTMTGDLLKLKLKPLTEASTVDTVIEKKIMSVLYVVLTEPVNVLDEKLKIIPLSSTKAEINLETELELNNFVSTANSDFILKYGNKNAFATVLTFDENDLLVNYANTFSAEIV